MLRLKYARQTRIFFSPPPAAAAYFFSTDVTGAGPISSPYPLPPSSITSTTNGSASEIHHSDLVHYFKDWFMSRKNPLFDRIFAILRSQKVLSTDSALSGLNLHLTENFVLDVLNYEEKKDVLSCLKFFDWAGQQPSFHHTRATFNAIFRMISNEKLNNLMDDLLQNFTKQKHRSVPYYNTLVIGYAVAGKSQIAVQQFAKMRYQGVDLDELAYHVLLNTLVEDGYFEYVESLVKEIRLRGFQCKVTHSIIVKSFCKQNELERGEEYLRGVLEGGNGTELNGIALATFISALCKNRQFERASLLMKEFQNVGLDSMGHAYGAWIKELVKAGRLDYALEFLKNKHVVDAYVPDIFRFNTLIWRLLLENRFEEVYDLLVDMKEMGVSPDDTTMNAVLCFLCKTGLVDIAIDLYDSRQELGLSVNYMAYNYLINTLLGDGSKEAYHLLIDSIEQGYLPGEKTFSIIADALCREGKLEGMKELIRFILDRNMKPSSSIYNKFISALCSIGRVEEGYLLHDLLNRVNKVSRKHVYKNLISGFSESNRGDIAARLIIEMQESGYRPSRKLYREVICCLCKMDNAENHFFGLLEMQLARNQLPADSSYNFFIDGAGHAGKPELAMQAYEIMRKRGVEPSSNSDILLLQSHLKNGKVAYALQLFCNFSVKWRKKKLWHVMIIGLCKVGEVEYASQILENMRKNMLTPSIQCYEELIKLSCDLGQYHRAVDIFNDMTRVGRPVSSFIGNVFLLHALRSRNLYDAWVSLSLKQNLTPASWMLGHLVGIFCGCVDGDYDDKYMESLIKKCFRTDAFTNNMLLRRLSMKGIDFACNFFYELCEKGYEPNKWGYDIILHGLVIDGRNVEAKMWMEEMLRKGFDLPRKLKDL